MIDFSYREEISRLSGVGAVWATTFQKPAEWPGYGTVSG